ncbi:hypothetical protein OS188_04350 [Xanthomarina sp. F1114]|uniref:hypothetical protein n=1 Tax=Xanthomarina sp. F1114 TaxID=2996019 RepID=UPI00225DE6D7|nr:hypothetical protein [Xanthomarina sp. F1114]MCX7547180.1 hypothetical protein [Xanthomarina sp. F1114]
MKTPIFLLLIFFSTFVFAQNKNLPTITFKDGSKVQFKKTSFNLDSDSYIIGIIAKTDNNVKTTYGVTEIESFNDNNTRYVPRQYKNTIYLFEEVIIGALSVYKSGKHYFLNNDEHGFREISRVVVNDKELNKFEYATLSVYINKCKEAQEQAYNKSQVITFGTLQSIVNTYNNCNLNEDIQFATNVITEANAPKEVIEVGVNLGYNFLNTSFDKLSPGVNNNYGALVLGAQVYFNTNMLKNNIGFVLLVDYTFPNEFKSSENSTFLKADLSYLTTMIGIRYTFNNMSKTFSPYLGFNGGFIFNSMATITEQQNIYGAPTYFYESSNKLASSFSAGTYIRFGKQKIDFNLTYQPETKFELINTHVLKSIFSYYKASGFQLKATYIF